MRKICLLVSIFMLSLLAATFVLAQQRLRMATTTSTEDSGLLKELLPPFNKANNCTVDVISTGTGKALKHGENGDVDVVLVHARKLEDKFVADGFGVERRDVMHNDFVIVGPKADPAGLKGTKTAVEAFKRLAEGKAEFISRGDESGTHLKEKELWKAAGIEPKGKWYVDAGQGMGNVLQMAYDKKAYTLADRGTYAAMAGKIDLIVLSEGDKAFFNPYSIIAVNPQKYPKVDNALAKKLIEFVTGPEGQKIIANFKPHGQQLFFPDATK